MAFCRVLWHALLLGTAALVYGAQTPLTTAGHGPSFHTWNQTATAQPLEELSLLSSVDYTHLSHGAFPDYAVRIKKSTFCDGTAAAYTGYIDIAARHLFFYFFESRRDPAADDVVFWTNGGPGGSSAIGLFMELGPCRVTGPRAGDTAFNPHAWNAVANVFFVDQPVGVGFSYAEHGEHVDTTEDAATDIAAFVAIFFEHFSKFKGRGFHFAGESYGGRYIPVFAAAVYEQNARLLEAHVTPINLQSVLIGNGCTDWTTMHRGYYEMQCTHVETHPVQGISTCVEIKRRLSRCEKWFRASCIDTKDAINCDTAYGFCAETLVVPYRALGLNPYDITKPCVGNSLCYDIIDDLEKYLNDPAVRKTIGADAAAGNYTPHNTQLGAAFWARQDGQFPTQLFLGGLLERGVRVLVYVGAHDFICNWRGNEAMTLALEWTGGDAFRGAPRREWSVGGDAAGIVRSSGNLAFATIYGAGHMAPYDKPAESLELVRRWLYEEDI
ncbi:peptidase S10, serine carboxypeptidase [Phanerochaete sordida]|uniref:carboxypeptidase C n=1 Tax=Phanerochaete sordida TaxID=48140 RepID=A0A9P3LKX5_9APHY|nr:peptidase S10, serine carboxypeptidase [Phanerochaete sordida]